MSADNVTEDDLCLELETSPPHSSTDVPDGAIAPMDQNNPYLSTQADLLQAAPGTEAELAERGTRLAAALLDGLLYLVFFIPALGFIGLGKLADPTWANAWTTKLLYLALCVPGLAINWYLVSRSGQTFGKKLMKIRMVRMDGSCLDAGRWLFLRSLPLQLLTQVPFVGPILGLVDAFMIFGKDRRCLHDQIADTKVVQA